jgi:hypothetical protein
LTTILRKNQKKNKETKQETFKPEIINKNKRVYFLKNNRTRPPSASVKRAGSPPAENRKRNPVAIGKIIVIQNEKQETRNKKHSQPKIINKKSGGPYQPKKTIYS